MNFDSSIHGAMGGVGFVIQYSNGRLLAVDGSFLFKPSILEAKLRTAWMGITCITQAERIFIERDSVIVIVWI